MKRTHAQAITKKRVAQGPRKKAKKDQIQRFINGPLVHGMNNASMREEKKWVDILGESQPITSTAGIVLINGIATGTNSFNRLGRGFFNLSVFVRYWFSPDSAANDLFYNRVLLVWDNQPNGALPLITDILADVSYTGGGHTDSSSGTNLNNKKRFGILRDARLLTPTSSSAGLGLLSVSDTPSANGKMADEWYVNLRGIETTCLSSTAAISDITTGALYFVYFNNDPALVSADWYINYNIRLRFRD